MGLILRNSATANSGNTVSVKGSALTYNEGDGNFVYLLTNMSGSRISLTGSVSVNGSITGSFSGSLANFTGTATHIPFFSSSQILADSSMFQVDNGGGSYSIALNQNGVSGIAPEALFVYQLSTTSYNVISGKGNLNNYLQLNIQNQNNGANASSDVVATANNGDENSNYIDMGINGASFGGSIGSANDAYVYATGSNFHIGNINPNTYLGLFTGGNDVIANNKLRLNPNNQHIMSGSLNISGSLIAQNISGSMTGSLFGTSSWANNALTASSADNFNVRNTLTAQTLVVQTITSSIDYVTGSTRFGSLISNTHTFTGSVLMTGSLTTTGSFTVVTGNLVEFQVLNTGVKIGNATSDAHSITGSLTTSGSFAVYNDISAEFQVLNTGIKIGNATSDAHSITGSLNISGSTTITGSMVVTGSQTFIGTKTITGSVFITGSKTLIGTNTLTGSMFISGALQLTGSLSASGSVSTNKIIGNSNTPTVISGSGAGSTSAATISIVGTDAAGIIRILTGNTTITKTDVINVTFSSAYSSLPYVLVTPANYSASLSLGGVSGTFSTSSATGFTIFSGDGALRSATAYSWSYHVVG
jgi:HPt (histidine-containing phosphotransfer) domain-containing protein